MGKNKNKGGRTAAVPPAPEVTAEEKVVEPEVINEQKKVEVIDANGLKEQLNNAPKPGLDANHQVDLLNGLDRHFMQPNAADKLHISQETVDKVNMFTAHGWVVVAATEGMFGTSAFAQAIRPAMLPVILEAAKDMDIVIDQKMLPAPSADGTIAIPSAAIKPSKEAKAALKKEHEILEKKPNVDPTKIENEAELKDAINFVMADAKNGWEKIKNSISFYRSYLAAKAEKDEKKDELLAELKEKTNLELLNEIRDLIHDCPIVLSGMGRSMGTFTGSTKSPIVAFCMLRNSATNRKTGETELTDREVADYVRAIVSWTASLNMETYKSRIVEHEKNLAVLSKDKKKNEAGIKDVNEKIESCKASIAHCEEIMQFVTDPSSEVADTLIENYNAKDRAAMSIFKWIVDTFYSDVDLAKADIAAIKHNVQQRAGIILNLFRDPLTPLVEYSEANLTEISTGEAEESKKE